MLGRDGRRFARASKWLRSKARDPVTQQNTLSDGGIVVGREMVIGPELPSTMEDI